MKIEEYKKIIDNIVVDPDNATILAGDLFKALEEDITIKEASAAEIEEKNNKIKELQDINIKLYLQQTTPAAEEAAEEKEGLEAFIEKLEKMEGDN